MADTDKVNILVVDDLPEKVLVLESVLAELGENIVTARSGAEALRLVLQHEFAVVLLDVNMPGMDGLETAAFIRRRKKCAHTPIIFITAYADEIHTAQGYSLGAVDYILAPIVPEILRTKVKVFVDLFRMSEQVKRQAEERVALAQEQALRAAAEEATRRSTFLAEASTQLASSLDYELAQRTLARLPVPLLAHWSAVTRIVDKSRLGLSEVSWIASSTDCRTSDADTGAASSACSSELRTAVVAPDELPPALAAVLQDALASGATRLVSESGVWTSPGEVARKSCAILGPSGTELKIRPPLALCGAMIVPLRARGRTLGLLTLARAAGEECFSSLDTALAEDLAARAAIALDNAQLYQDIQEGDRRKDEFLAMLAHELRNPLAPVRNAVEILQFVQATEPLLAKARDIINRQVTHLTRLVDDLLDVSRLSRGKILLRRERLDVGELVREVVADHDVELEAAGLTLHLETPAEPLWVYGDRTRLAQIIGNLLNNAGKFTDAGGAVLVRLASLPKQAADGSGHLPCDSGRVAVLSVRDTGIGMDPQTLAGLFKPFSQADRSLDRSRGGLGLGLALVKGLVELHGGEVQAYSAGSAQGAEFIVRLPIEEPAEVFALPEGGDANDAVTAAVASLRVLLVEDNADAAESLRLLLSHIGHRVQVAMTGAVALEVAPDFRPHVVLCDVGLPGGMDGYAVARAFRSHPELRSIYLVAATGYGRPEDQQLAHDAGFDHHLTKPVRLQDLRKLLSSVADRDSPQLSAPSQN